MNIQAKLTKDCVKFVNASLASAGSFYSFKIHTVDEFIEMEFIAGGEEEAVRLSEVHGLPVEWTTGSLKAAYRAICTPKIIKKIFS